MRLSIIAFLHNNFRQLKFVGFSEPVNFDTPALVLLAFDSIQIKLGSYASSLLYLF